MLDDPSAGRRVLLNKVPEVTVFFWAIKCLCTTVGETAADFLNLNLGFGLTGTSITTGALVAITLVVQFRTVRYIAPVYWLAVVLISVFGTLVTDNLTDALGVPLELSTMLFGGLLLVTFALWYWEERTLSIQSIVTARREGFYWLAVLLTFALGTAAGDLMAEKLGLGYATTGIIVAVIAVLIAAAWRLGLNAILAFWVVYILTRPLGASLGDYLSQSEAHGGLGLGATLTTELFFLCIFATVLYLAVTKKDVAREHASAPAVRKPSPIAVFGQVALVVVLFAAAAAGGYAWQSDRIRAQLHTAASAKDGKAPLGDLAQFSAMTQAMLESVNAGDWSRAKDTADEIEYAWDSAESRLRPADAEAWSQVDDAIDGVLREVRSISPHQEAARSALQTLEQRIANP
jgi:uncharacterized membrane-anchored protein